MSLLTRGVTRLSQIEIDADKDWQGFGISNLKEVAQAMGHGDMAFKTTSSPVLVKLPTVYGVGNNYLHAKSIGGGRFEPEWKDIQDLINYVTGGVNRVMTVPTLTVPVPPPVSKQTVANSSPPGRTSERILSVPDLSGISSIGSDTAANPGGAVAAASALAALDLPTISKGLATRYAVGGAVADDGGVQTNETGAANNAATNDMTLLPAVPAVDDAYYFGYSALWDYLRLRVDTPGAGTWSVVWEYWNGAAWVSLTGVSDPTGGFRPPAIGEYEIAFTRPADWATTTVLAMTLFWIRARVSAYTSITTQPKGTQAWTWVKH